MDYSSVYRCMHIYSVIREADTFKAYYRQQRQQQARLVLQPPINMVIILYCSICNVNIYSYIHVYIYIYIYIKTKEIIFLQILLLVESASNSFTTIKNNIVKTE
jgi:hypothetical protein